MVFQIVAADSGNVGEKTAQSVTSVPQLYYRRAKESPDFSPWKHVIPLSTQNEYWILQNKNTEEIVGYGFLRGWDEGWDDMCLGIVVNPKYRGRGQGYSICKLLLYAAKCRKLKRVRLHVWPGNKPALKLYRKLGFKFDGRIRSDGELIAWYTL